MKKEYNHNKLLDLGRENTSYMQTAIEQLHEDYRKLDRCLYDVEERVSRIEKYLCNKRAHNSRVIIDDETRIRAGGSNDSF